MDSTPEVLTDSELVQAILSGKKDDFKELIRRYEQKIFRMAYSFCFQKENAEDLTQEIFMRTFQKLSYYNPQYPFCSWILRLSTHYLINEQKRKQVRSVLMNDEHLTQIPQPQTYTTLYQIPQFEERLQNALAQLPEPYQDVFRLYHLQKLSYQEIADILEKPINTIKTHLFRARMDLRERLKTYLE